MLPLNQLEATVYKNRWRGPAADPSSMMGAVPARRRVENA
ncbi:hypothetical protein JOF47_000530 [Paeniglutamicibacter kerguelensis]|uniref:Uncharacterized protein n=1 Tax=Paeniglutamicibacter kerguelensis TaxID=254788 RepID=A0ABS4X975_9MICC|nr:hypothetical protein [Paeniglutamicibacter kerguelensis]